MKIIHEIQDFNEIRYILDGDIMRENKIIPGGYSFNRMTDISVNNLVLYVCCLHKNYDSTTYTEQFIISIENTTRGEELSIGCRDFYDYERFCVSPDSSFILFKWLCENPLFVSHFGKYRPSEFENFKEKLRLWEESQVTQNQTLTERVDAILSKTNENGLDNGK